MPVSRTSGRLFSVLLSILGAILIIVTSYLIYKQKQPAHVPAPEIFLETQKKPVPESRHEGHSETAKSVTKSAFGPAITGHAPIPIENSKTVPRVLSNAVTIAPDIAPARVPKFTATPVRSHVRMSPNIPKVEVMPNAILYADIPTLTLQEEMSFTTPTAPRAKNTPVGSDGIVGTQVRAARASVKPKGLSMIKNISVADTGLTGVVKAVTFGRVAVAPLPKGEPGGRVIGRGKDIRGVFRLVRVQHSLADWWADQSSLVALIQWLNTQTEIKTDMNVEGGSLRLTDPKLSKAPLAFFTGHDAYVARSHELMRGNPLRNRLTEPERDGLRRYLVEDGGFIYFDDCGVNAPAEAFVRLFMAQLRNALPESIVDRIPNNHLIYNNYYDMGGPPVGYNIFWWGTHPPRRNFLEGITIEDDLRVLVCRRDYLCAMETVSFPSKAVHYSPGVYRFSTNVVIYALTHGGISDYSAYVPEDTVTDRISINVPTVVPELE